MDTTKFPELVEKIYAIVEELEAMTDNSDYVNGKRLFTPDGHMVGSMGEVLAMHHYGIVLDKASNEKHDGIINGRNVQIKATQIDKISISSEPDFLLVLKINKKGVAEEIYNGPGNIVWNSEKLGKKQKTGQCQISLNNLRELQKGVTDNIERINP